MIDWLSHLGFKFFFAGVGLFYLTLIIILGVIVVFGILTIFGYLGHSTSQLLHSIDTKLKLTKEMKILSFVSVIAWGLTFGEVISLYLALIVITLFVIWFFAKSNWNKKNLHLTGTDYEIANSKFQTKFILSLFIGIAFFVILGSLAVVFFQF